MHVLSLAALAQFTTDVFTNQYVHIAMYNTHTNVNVQCNSIILHMASRHKAQKGVQI